MEIMLGIVAIGFIGMCYMTFTNLRKEIHTLEITNKKQRELIETLEIQNEDLAEFKYKVVGVMEAKATIIRKHDIIKELVNEYES